MAVSERFVAAVVARATENGTTRGRELAAICARLGRQLSAAEDNRCGHALTTIEDMHAAAARAAGVSHGARSASSRAMRAAGDYDALERAYRAAWWAAVVSACAAAGVGVAAESDSDAGRVPEGD